MNVPMEMLDRYFERRKRDLSECIQHLKNGETGFLEKVGHKLKGNGVTFGFPELSEIGVNLEEAARAGDNFKIAQALENYSQWIKEHTS